MVTRQRYKDVFLSTAALCESGFRQVVMDFDDVDHPGACQREPLDIEVGEVIRRAGQMMRGELGKRDWDTVSNDECIWQNNLRWAYKDLREERRVVSVRRGKLQLTPEGRARAAILNEQRNQ